jgi:hypothetical protein
MPRSIFTGATRSAGAGGGRAGLCCSGEADLEHGSAVGRPRTEIAHDLCERIVLVGHRLLEGGPDLPDEVGHRAVVGHADAQRQRAGGGADQVLGLGVRAVSDGQADDQVGLTGPAPQRQRVGGQQRGQPRGA